jgi:hypothetical protein
MMGDESEAAAFVGEENPPGQPGPSEKVPKRPREETATPPHPTTKPCEPRKGKCMLQSIPPVAKGIPPGETMYVQIIKRAKSIPEIPEDPEDLLGSCYQVEARHLRSWVCATCAEELSPEP